MAPRPIEDREYKDRVHARLMKHCEIDPETGCWVYTGSWGKDGIGMIGIRRKVYTVCRVAAWLYVPGFDLDGPQVPVRRCRTPACCNYSHLLITANRAEAARAIRQRDRNLIVNAIRREGSRIRLQATTLPLEHLRLIRGWSDRIASGVFYGLNLHNARAISA